MQKPHFVAQGAALAKVMEVSIVVDWWGAAPRRAFLWRCGGLVSGAAATARSREALAGLSAVNVETARAAETFTHRSENAAVVLR